MSLVINYVFTVVISSLYWLVFQMSNQYSVFSIIYHKD